MPHGEAQAWPLRGGEQGPAQLAQVLRPVALGPAYRRGRTAAASGIDIPRARLIAFVISGAVTGLAGALHAMMTGLAPLSNAEHYTSEMILVMTVIGGTGNLLASVLGSAFYLLLGDWLSALWPRWLLVLGLILMAVSLWMQRGLWGLGESIWRRLARQGEQA